MGRNSVAYIKTLYNIVDGYITGLVPELSIKLDRKRVYAISVCIKQRWIATYANA